MSEGKIIGVGFQKTGTSSLREALKILGYRVMDTSERPLVSILKGDHDRVLRMIRNYDALEDTPWYMIYRELDRLIPGSKFILTTRDEESWYRSVARHIGRLRNPSHEWIYGRGKGLPMDDRENTLRVYQEHIKGVKSYFRERPGDLLVIDVTNGDGWKELCGFLGRPAPDARFPHVNEWKAHTALQEYYGQKKDLGFYRKQLRHSIRIKYIDWKKLW
jgi:hypothetical protein